MSDRLVLDRRWYAGLTAGWVAFIVYGSLVPFQYMPHPGAVAAFGEVLAEGVVIDSRSDWVANCLLGVPLGFGLLAALRVDRPGRALLSALHVLPLCALIAAAVEFAQLYFPPRNCSASDILAQVLGAMAGVAAWLALGQWLTDRVRRAWSDPRAGGAAGRVLLGYLVLVLLVQLLPLDIEVRPLKMWRRYKAGDVTVLPFSEWSQPGHDPWGNVQNWLELAALFFPVGLLMARLPGRGWRSLPLIALAGLAIAAITEAAQICVSRQPSITDALVGGVGVLVGAAVVFLFRSVAGHPPNNLTPTSRP